VEAAVSAAAGEAPSATTERIQFARTIPSCAKRNEYSSASCLIRSLKAVPIPCPELVLVRSKIGLLDLLA
jgi:hypothetical protein